MTQDERIAASPEAIYLEPLDCACPYEGRQWCEDDVGSETEMGAPVPWIKYVRADIAARPKLTTITGLPETLPDGTRIVGWKWGAVSSGDWIVSDDEADNPSVAQVRKCHGVYMALIAITEADNG